MTTAVIDLDNEECESCADLEDVCDFHRGVAAGVHAFASRLAALAADPDLLNGAVTGPVEMALVGAGVES